VTPAITDATGTVFLATANQSGNFSLESDHFVYPFTARITFEGRERRMTGAQKDGDCNGCHTTAGSNGAPGRVLLP
jgi:hypothetical protein